ncbi:MAG: amidohydrolase family protein [Chloroflexi bacterium]|nr:amidohydrolase family protein [Chloroflexota bacterium]
MSIPIIDCLTHISTGPDDVVGWGPRFLAEDLLAQMDAPRKVFGEPRKVDRAIVFPSLALTIPTSRLTFEEQHAYVVESVAKYPDRFIGGIVMHPRLWNDQVRATVYKMVKEQGFRMIYLNPSIHKFWLPIKTPSEGEGARKMLYPIFEAARELGIPVIIHTGEQPYALPATVDFVAGAFPDVNIIIAHLGTQGEMFTIEALLVADRHPNVYLETSWAMPHMLIEAVHEAGADRLIFGSNCPPLEPTQQIMNVEEAMTYDPPIGMGASVDDTRKVLGGNLAKMLGL